MDSLKEIRQLRQSIREQVAGGDEPDQKDEQRLAELIQESGTADEIDLGEDDESGSGVKDMSALSDSSGGALVRPPKQKRLPKPPRIRK